jgi:type I restriction enzyme, S subunit
VSCWPNVALAELLTKSNDWIQLDAEGEYKEVTVRNRGQGAVLRRLVSGGEIAATRRLRVHPRQFIISRIDARHGSSGVIPASLDGAIVTNDFPVFDCDESVLLPEFLGWYSRTPRFVDECRHASEGSTNRVRLKEASFLDITMPLPPIEDQRRIVGVLDKLAAARSVSERLRSGVVNDVMALSQVASRMAFSAYDDAPRLTIADVCTEIIDCLHSNPVYSEEGIPTLRSPDVGWGSLLLGTARRTSDMEYSRRTQRGEPRSGDIVLVREGGGTGKAGIVEDGQKLSLGQRVMLLRPNTALMLPRFLLLQWLSPLVQDDQIATRIKGSASPHLNIGALKRFRVACPTITQQQAVVDRLESFDKRLRKLQALTTEASRLTRAASLSTLHRAIESPGP